MATVCVFCGSRSGNSETFVSAADYLGVQLAQLGHTLVYGGGSVGIMGRLADATMQHGGHVIGVIPQALANIELMHTQVQDMRIVADMHARKALMHELADAYIALPGGFGTLEELFEVLCWAQLDFHRSPVAVWSVDGYYDGLKILLKNMVDRDFLSDVHLSILHELRTTTELDRWLLTLNDRTAALESSTGSSP